MVLNFLSARSEPSVALYMCYVFIPLVLVWIVINLEEEALNLCELCNESVYVCARTDKRYMLFS